MKYKTLQPVLHFFVKPELLVSGTTFSTKGTIDKPIKPGRPTNTCILVSSSDSHTRYTAEWKNVAGGLCRFSVGLPIAWLEGVSYVQSAAY